MKLISWALFEYVGTEPQVDTLPMAVKDVPGASLRLLVLNLVLRSGLVEVSSSTTSTSINNTTSPNTRNDTKNVLMLTVGILLFVLSLVIVAVLIKGKTSLSRNVVPSTMCNLKEIHDGKSSPMQNFPHEQNPQASIPSTSKATLKELMPFRRNLPPVPDTLVGYQENVRPAYSTMKPGETSSFSSTNIFKDECLSESNLSIGPEAEEPSRSDIPNSRVKGHHGVTIGIYDVNVQQDSKAYALVKVIDADCAPEHLVQAAMITAPPILPFGVIYDVE